MFDDPKEALRRLEQRLLAEEDRKGPEEPEFEEDWLEDELAEAHRLLGDDPDGDDDDDSYPAAPTRRQGSGVRNYANGYGAARNTDPADLNMEEYSDRVYRAPREKGVGGLVLLACLETLGIVALVAYWLVVLL